MRYLIDTHVFLWMLRDPEEISERVRASLFDLDNEVYVSAISVFEIAVKRAKGKLTFEGNINKTMRTMSFHELPVRGLECEASANLPQIHKDPFDRILVVQAQQNGLVLVTRDAALLQYEVPTIEA